MHRVVLYSARVERTLLKISLHIVIIFNIKVKADRLAHILVITEYVFIILHSEYLIMQQVWLEKFLPARKHWISMDYLDLA